MCNGNEVMFKWIVNYRSCVLSVLTASQRLGKIMRRLEWKTGRSYFLMFWNFGNTVKTTMAVVTIIVEEHCQSRKSENSEDSRGSGKQAEEEPSSSNVWWGSLQFWSSCVLFLLLQVWWGQFEHGWTSGGNCSSSHLTNQDHDCFKK